jgi:hypothetical protein
VYRCAEGCRLSRGDGELVQAMVKSLEPTHLCLDFDRTLSSTKRGACASYKVVPTALDAEH